MSALSDRSFYTTRRDLCHVKSSNCGEHYYGDFPTSSIGDFPGSQLIVDRMYVYSIDPRMEVMLKNSDVEMLQLELEAESVKFLSEWLDSNQKKSLEVEQQTHKRMCVQSAHPILGIVLCTHEVTMQGREE